MKSLRESLFDADLVSKETGYEYLYGLVKWVDYISVPDWVFPNWIKDYVTRVGKNASETFRIDAIRNDYKNYWMDTRRTCQFFGCIKSYN